MLRLSKERDELRVVADQIGAPTWSRMIAEMTGQALACVAAPKGLQLSDVSGTYHLTGSGSTSWFGFTQAILENVTQRGISDAGATSPHLPRLVPITTNEYPTPAQRPQNSQMSNAKLARVFGLVSPAWDSQLHLCMRDVAI